MLPTGSVAPDQREATCRRVETLTVLTAVAGMVAVAASTFPTGALAAVKWTSMISLLVTLSRVPLARASMRRGLWSSIGITIVPSLSLYWNAGSLSQWLTLGSLALGLWTAIAAGTFISNYSREPVQVLKRIGRAAEVLAIAATIMSLIGLDLGRSSTRATGWVDNPNSLGFLLVAALSMKPLSGQQSVGHRGFFSRLYPTGSTLLLIAGVALSGSRATALAVMTAFTLRAWYTSKRTALALFLIGTSVLALISPNFASAQELLGRTGTGDLSSGRTELWKIAWEYGSDTWLLGRGHASSPDFINNTSLVFIDYDSFSAGNFHSTWVEAWFSWGLPGLLISITTLGLIVSGASASGARTAENATRSGFLAACVVHAFFETWIFNAGSPTFMLFWVAAAFFPRSARNRSW